MERIRSELAYLRRQLSLAMRANTRAESRDAASRAMDALERLEEELAKLPVQHPVDVAFQKALPMLNELERKGEEALRNMFKG